MGTVLAVVILLFAPRAEAFVTQYGFGPASTELAGMTAAGPSDAFSAYLNPARLGDGLSEDHRFRATWGLEYLHADFTPITNIVINSPVISGVSGPVVGNYDASVPDGFGQWLGVEYLVTPFWNLTVGAAAFLPLNGLAQLDTGPIYQPSYVLYGSSWQVPKVVLSAGVQPAPWLRFGLGASVNFAATANVDLYLQASDGTASDQRVQEVLTPTIAPLMGLDIDTGFGHVGLTVRAQSVTTVTLNTSASARVFGDLQAAIDFGYLSTASLDFEPWSFELGYRFPELAGLITPMIQVSYQMWKEMQLPEASINNSSQFQPTLTPDVVFQDIFVITAGAEFRIGSVIARIGYTYRPSIFADLPSDVGNLIDPDRHLVGLGVSIPLTDKLTLDVDGQFQYLVPDNVVKTPGDEFGNESGEKIGAPGYPIGGFVYGGGLSISYTP